MGHLSNTCSKVCVGRHARARDGYPQVIHKVIHRGGGESLVPDNRYYVKPAANKAVSQCEMGISLYGTGNNECLFVALSTIV